MVDEPSEPPNEPVSPKASSAPAGREEPEPECSGSESSDERRTSQRVPVTWEVECQGADTFLYATITNASELGVFVRTEQPLPPGTLVTLRFAAPGAEAFMLTATVQWINPLKALGTNPNPGMGLRFHALAAADHARLLEVIHTLAFVHTPTV